METRIRSALAVHGMLDSFNHPADRGHLPEQVGPSVRPLGVLALTVAVVCVVLSVTYFLSPLAYVVSVLALPLGVAARADAPTPALGNVALGLTGVGFALATVVLLVA